MLHVHLPFYIPVQFVVVGLNQFTPVLCFMACPNIVHTPPALKCAYYSIYLLYNTFVRDERNGDFSCNIQTISYKCSEIRSETCSIRASGCEIAACILWVIGLGYVSAHTHVNRKCHRQVDARLMKAPEPRMFHSNPQPSDRGAH